MLTQMNKDDTQGDTRSNTQGDTQEKNNSNGKAKSASSWTKLVQEKMF